MLAKKLLTRNFDHYSKILLTYCRIKILTTTNNNFCCIFFHSSFFLFLLFSISMQKLKKWTGLLPALSYFVIFRRFISTKRKVCRGIAAGEKFFQFLKIIEGNGPKNSATGENFFWIKEMKGGKRKISAAAGEKKLDNSSFCHFGTTVLGEGGLTFKMQYIFMFFVEISTKFFLFSQCWRKKISKNTQFNSAWCEKMFAFTFLTIS